MADTGVAVIGAGVVGLAVAARLAPSSEVVILERRARHGQETSSRNSEVIHGGMYYPEGSLKARLCVEGNRAIYEICAANDIAHKRCGKIITATEPAELPALDRILATGTANDFVETALTAFRGGGGSDWRSTLDELPVPVYTTVRSQDGRLVPDLTKDDFEILDNGRPVDFDTAVASGASVGVPGTVRGMAMAHAKFGKLPWKQVVTPAADLAAKGWLMSGTLARGLNSEVAGSMKAFPASVAAFGKPDGKPWAEGDHIKLPDLGKSLAAIAEGPDAFYTGWIADRIAEDMAANGGLISKADLAAYKAVERAPVRGTFLGHEIISMPPPSSG